jgi:hypothetical protein
MNEQNIRAELATVLRQQFEITVSENISFSELETKLAFAVNELLKTNFEKLLFVLYRVDVNEQKLKQTLANHKDTDAGLVIARLLIERQVQKITSRQAFNRPLHNDDAEDKW